MTLDELIDILKSNQYKITAQRKAILQILANHHHGVLTVEDIYSQAKNIYPKTNMSTVYRNLETLEELDLLYKIMNDNGAMSYKIICCTEHHHHIICQDCGKTEVIDFCPLETFKELASEKNYKLSGHKLELYGFCEKCSKKHL